MRTIPHMVLHVWLQAMARVPSSPDARTRVVCFIGFFAVSTVIALSPTAFFNSLVWWSKRRVVMSPRVLLAYRALAIFCAVGALWQIYMALRVG